MKKKFLELWQNSEQNTCTKGSLFLQLHQKRNSDTGIFCKMVKNTFCTKHLRATASGRQINTYCLKAS